MRRIKKDRIILGIDEVGRGPLAGPVTVCAVFASKSTLREIKKACFYTDSKKMTQKRREAVFEVVKAESVAGRLTYAISSVSAKVIDRAGISKAIDIAVKRSLKKLQAKEDTPVLLDGGLKAPAEFTNQKSIKGGDSSEDAVALASVLAKVHRDKKMVRYDLRFPGYGFASNKGYGTKCHLEAVSRRGVCKIHRRSFLKNIIITSHIGGCDILPF